MRIGHTEIPLEDHTDMLGPLRAHAHKVTKGVLLRVRQRTVFEQAKHQAKNPTAEQTWVLDGWRPRGGERYFFVTDLNVVLIRNLNRPYIVDLLDPTDAKQPERVTYFRLRRNIPVFLVKAFDEKSLEAASMAVDELLKNSR